MNYSEEEYEKYSYDKKDKHQYHRYIKKIIQPKRNHGYYRNNSSKRYLENLEIAREKKLENEARYKKHKKTY